MDFTPDTGDALAQQQLIAALGVRGFFTKFAGLNKRRVRALARALGAPERLVNKTPTADLGNLRPLRPDEDAHGVSYDEIDDFLEGKPVSAAVAAPHRRTAVR